MSSNTKIVVLRSKELIYALVLLVVSVLIIMVAVSLFMPSQKNDLPMENTEENTSDETTEPDSDTSSVPDSYVPGLYTSTMVLGSANVELQIAVDSNHINSITISNLDESVATLYPLMAPTLSELASTILSEQSIENVSYTDENRYTSMLLMQTISATLDKARASENADSPETGTLY